MPTLRVQVLLLILPLAIFLLGLYLTHAGRLHRANRPLLWIGPGYVLVSVAMVLQIVVDSRLFPSVGLWVAALCFAACHGLCVGMTHRYGGTINHWISVPIAFSMMALVAEYAWVENDFGKQNLFLSFAITAFLIMPVKPVAVSASRSGRLDNLLRGLYLLLVAWSMLRTAAMSWVELTVPDVQMMNTPLWISVTLTGMAIAFALALVIALASAEENARLSVSEVRNRTRIRVRADE